MPPRIGYLLPTRESVMEGRPEAAPLIALAERAEGLGFDSIWVGDSILARPRHEPLTLLAAVAARTRRAELGTAVLLPALRNPVVLAHGNLGERLASRVERELRPAVVVARGLGDLDDEQHVRRPGVPLRVEVGAWLEDAQVRLRLGPAAEDDRILNPHDRTPVKPAREERVQAVDTGRVSGADRAHADDLAFDELDAIVLREDAGLGHPVVLLGRERPPRDLGSHRHSRRCYHGDGSTGETSTRCLSAQ